MEVHITAQRIETANGGGRRSLEVLIYTSEENADNVGCQMAAIFCNFQELNMYSMMVSRSICWDVESILCVFQPNMFVSHIT